MEQKISELIEVAEYELFHYPVTTKKQDVKYLIKRIFKPKDTPKRDRFFWPHALLTQALESAEKIDLLKKYYDVWIEKGLPIQQVDNVMNGYSLLYVYSRTGEGKYKLAAEQLYEYVCRYGMEMGNPLPYRRNHPTHVYVDGLGMVVPFLCRYGSVFKRHESIKLGVEQVRDFLKYGMDAETGLPYHGYDKKTKVKQGIIGWGRAVGWLMLAIADSIQYLPDGNEKEELLIAFARLTRSVMKYHREDGYFSWQLTATEGPKDTSATAMIGYALKKVTIVLNIDLFQEWQDTEQKMRLEESIKKIENAIERSCKNGKIYDCSGECEGFSQYPQVYRAYPWSLGPGLRFFLCEVKNNGLVKQK